MPSSIAAVQPTRNHELESIAQASLSKRTKLRDLLRPSLVNFFSSFTTGIVSTALSLAILLVWSHLSLHAPHYRLLAVFIGPQTVELLELLYREVDWVGGVLASGGLAIFAYMLGSVSSNVESTFRALSVAQRTQRKNSARFGPKYSSLRKISNSLQLASWLPYHMELFSGLS